MHSSSHPPREVTAGQINGSAEVRDLTRLVMRKVVTDLRLGRWPDGNIANDLRRTCDAARAQGLRAEQLLILLKDSWRRLPDVRYVQRDEADAALSDVVSTCIKEFYRLDVTH